MVAMSASVGVLLVLLAPLAVSLGLAGTLRGGAGVLVAVLRTRLCQLTRRRLVGLVSGGSGWSRRRRRSCGCIRAGGCRRRSRSRPPGPSDGRGPGPGLGRMPLARAGDVVELLGLLALVPMLVIATGLVLLRTEPGGVMPTRRELAEAHAFERRRLVNAFQGSDSGRARVERTRPGRVVAASIGLGSAAHRGRRGEWRPRGSSRGRRALRLGRASAGGPCHHD